MYYPSWYPYCERREAHNFLWGPDPDNTTQVTSDLLEVILTYWKKNTIRPSTVMNETIFLTTWTIS
ncbi:MAG: hypothetical protein HXS47_12705, partial [Theionarchaea archaeon]|nr:hypothetical protein [Theionarchaea archaeon]MBU7044443.1 hypothetical protein [Theionarchaea archaeon]